MHTGFLPAVGTIAFAFVCQHQTFLAWRSLRNVTQRRFAISIHLAMLGGLSLSLVLAIAGYLTFFETTNSDILFNYESAWRAEEMSAVMEAEAEVLGGSRRCSGGVRRLTRCDGGLRWPSRCGKACGSPRAVAEACSGGP